MACGDGLPEVEALGQGQYLTTVRGERAATTAARAAASQCLDRLEGMQVVNVSVQDSATSMRFGCGGPMVFGEGFEPNAFYTYEDRGVHHGSYTSRAATPAIASAGLAAFAHAYCARLGIQHVTVTQPGRDGDLFNVAFTCP